jgi:hypothetical protein
VLAKGRDYNNVLGWYKRVTVVFMEFTLYFLIETGYNLGGIKILDSSTQRNSTTIYAACLGFIGY